MTASFAKAGLIAIDPQGLLYFAATTVVICRLPGLGVGIVHQDRYRGRSDQEANVPTALWGFCGPYFLLGEKS